MTGTAFEAMWRLLTLSAIGSLVGWFISGIPLYVWRHRISQLQAAPQFRRLP